MDGWLRGEESNLRTSAYETLDLPLSYPAIDAGTLPAVTPLFSIRSRCWQVSLSGRATLELNLFEMLKKVNTVVSVNKKDTHKLQVEMVNISELVPYAKNSRTHSDQQIDQIAKSIKQFGFTNPVLIHKGGKIIAGHGRVLAASRINQMEIPVIRLEHLTDFQAKALVIADNQIAMMAGWDFDVLASEIDALNDQEFDLDLLGFTKEELDDLIGSPDEPLETPEEKPKKPESDTTICPKCHHEFVL